MSEISYVPLHHAKQQTILTFSSVGSVPTHTYALIPVAVSPCRIYGVRQHGIRHICKRCAGFHSWCMVRQRYSLLYQRCTTYPYVASGISVNHMPMDA